MRGWKRLTWGVLGAAVVAGCATSATSAPREPQAERSATQSDLERQLAEHKLAAAQYAERLKEETAQADRAEVQRLRTEAEQQQARLAEEQARMGQLNTQLEQERQARLEAEQRATQAEAQALAQTAVADELRNIQQVQVKEEPRGLVLTLSGSVLFRSGSSDLLPSAERRLDEVAEALKKTQSPLLIEGHTDSQGSEELNDELSNARAESVRDYLAEKGVDSERIRTTGMGEARPIASNKSPEGRANNRRVEIVIERGVGGAGSQQEQKQAPSTPEQPAPAKPSQQSAPVPPEQQPPTQIPQPVPTP